jgi:meckelin
MDVSRQGSLLDLKECVTCASGIADGRCIQCPEFTLYDVETGRCECLPDYTATNDAGCLSLSELQVVEIFGASAESQQVIYRAIEKEGRLGQNNGFGNRLGLEVGDEVDEVMDPNPTVLNPSDTMLQLFVSCAVNCLRWSPVGCQCIANLCVLQMYEQATPPCKLITYLRNDDKVAQALEDLTGAKVKSVSKPWLFYEEDGDGFATKVYRDPAYATRIGFTESDPLITLWVARYAIEGTFLGWRKVRDEFELCARYGGTTAGLWQRFGASVFVTCDLSIPALLDCGANPEFYEPYIELEDKSLYPVPVRIVNAIDMAGVTPNVNVDIDEEFDDEFVRRYALCDAVSSLQGLDSYKTRDTSKAKVVRWAAHVLLQFRLHDEVDSRIYVPTLSIRYSELDTSGSINVGTTTFKAEYTMNSQSPLRFAWRMLFFSLCVGLGWGIMRTKQLSRRYPSDLPAGQHKFLPKSILAFREVANSLRAAFFGYYFGLCMMWFTILKFQEDPMWLLPSSLDYYPYLYVDLFLLVLVGMGLVSVILDIMKASSTSFIFLDRETVGKINGQQVSGWRSIFVGNELNERQCECRTKPHVTWLVAAILLEGMDWKDAGRWTPILSGASVAQSPFNPVLQIALSFIAWNAAILAQLFVRFVLSLVFGSDVTDFVDLCALTNISVVIMDEPYHGWYIHGAAPRGEGDVSEAMILERLSSIEQMEKRGFYTDEGTNGELQTFEVFFGPHEAGIIAAGHTQLRDAMKRRGAQAKSARSGNPGFQGFTDAHMASNVNHELRSALIFSFDRMRQQNRVRPRTQKEWFWNESPKVDEMPHGSSLCYEDKSLVGWLAPLTYGTENYFKYPIGTELRIIHEELLLFCVVFRFTHSVYLAVAIAYAFGVVVLKIRETIGKSNLSNSVAIDERFFL